MEESLERPGNWMWKSDQFEMGQTGGSIVVSFLEKKLGKPASEITGDVVTGICVPGLMVLENRAAGEIAYLRKAMPKINILKSVDSQVDRTRNFALWDQAARKTPNALTYVGPCEYDEENLVKILSDKGKIPLIDYNNPEETRDDIAQGLVTAAVPGNFFIQAYLAVYIAAQSLLNGKGRRRWGWVR
jgi:ribose transport system substrate-binding protein